MDSCAKQKRQAFYQLLMDRMNAKGHFSSNANILIDKLDEGFAQGTLDIHPENLNMLGYVHGGCLATLADTVAGMGVIASGYAAVTANYGLNFLRPATGNQIRCIATAEKMGRTLCVMRVELFNDTSKPVAAGSFTFCLTEPLDLDNPFGWSNTNAE